MILLSGAARLGLAAAEFELGQPPRVAPAAMTVQSERPVIARPRRSQETVQKARPSKYDPPRDFLAGKGGVPTSLTFTQIQRLVGTTSPVSAAIPPVVARR